MAEFFINKMDIDLVKLHWEEIKYIIDYLKKVESFKKDLEEGTEWFDNEMRMERENQLLKEQRGLEENIPAVSFKKLGEVV
jgi:hypothetical protein